MGLIGLTAGNSPPGFEMRYNEAAGSVCLETPGPEYAASIPLSPVAWKKPTVIACLPAFSPIWPDLLRAINYRQLRYDTRKPQEGVV